METHETFEHAPTRPGLELNLQAQDFLREAAKWSGFLGIVGFILTAFILLGALFAGSILATIASFQSAQDPLPSAMAGGLGAIVGVAYVVEAAIYFFFSLYLYQFGSRTKKGLMLSDSHEISRAMGKLKSFFKLWGILTIIALCLIVLFVIFCIAIGVGTSIIHR